MARNIAMKTIVGKIVADGSQLWVWGPLPGTPAAPRQSHGNRGGSRAPPQPQGWHQAANPAAAVSAFETTITAALQQVADTPLGAFLMAIIGTSPLAVTIVPTNDTTNAGALADNGPAARTNANGSAGIGSTVHVIINPKIDTQGIGLPAILLHELVHAWRQTRGRWNPTPAHELLGTGLWDSTNADSAMDNWEEWLAVVIESTWRASLPNISRVRATHQRPGFFDAFDTEHTGLAYEDGIHAPWGSDLPTHRTASQEFVDQWVLGFFRLTSEEAELFNLLVVRRGIWFNPSRDFWFESRDPARLQRWSRLVTAGHR